MATVDNAADQVRQRQVQACAARATKALRDKYSDEYDSLLEAEYAAAGIEVKRRLRGEAKRRADIARYEAALAELRAQEAASEPTE